jgi:hypothetical protein
MSLMNFCGLFLFLGCCSAVMAEKPLTTATAWPIPYDIDGDGDYDLLVSREGKDVHGLFLWENTSGDTAKNKWPTFQAERRLGDTVPRLMPSYVEGKMRLLAPVWEVTEFSRKGLLQKKPLFGIPNISRGDQQWRFADFNGDGHQDLIVGVAYGEEAQKLQVLRGSSVQVCYGRADGTFAEPFMLLADGKSILMTELPSPNFSNFDEDDDLDLLCVSANGGFIYYENSNTNSEPLYAKGKPLCDALGKEVKLPSQKLVAIVFDWDRDGDLDLIVGDAEGRVALMEHSGTVRDHMPVFLQPVYFRQQADQP